MPIVTVSIDCVLCNPSHPHTIDSHGKFRLLLGDGVDAAVEVKPDIAGDGLHNVPTVFYPVPAAQNAEEIAHF